MSLSVKCDGCYNSLFNGQKIFCEECYKKELSLKQRYERELEVQAQEIASLRAELKRLKKK